MPPKCVHCNTRFRSRRLDWVLDDDNDVMMMSHTVRIRPNFIICNHEKWKEGNEEACQQKRTAERQASAVKQKPLPSIWWLRFVYCLTFFKKKKKNFCRFFISIAKFLSHKHILYIWLIKWLFPIALTHSRWNEKRKIAMIWQ